MTRRRQIRTPEEQDVYTGWRKFLHYTHRAGMVKRVKRRTHKRERREGREEISGDMP